MKRVGPIFILCAAVAVLGSAPGPSLGVGWDPNVQFPGASVFTRLANPVSPDFSPQNRPQDYGPWNRDLEWYASSDGLMFSKKGTFVERGGVPSLAKAIDGRLQAVFQWFPLSKKEAFDQVAFKISSDLGESWTSPELIQVSGLPPQLFRVFDPTLVGLPGGGFRLYFSSERIGPLNSRGNRAIFSAVSGDGIHFLFEPGQRFGFDDSETYDCAVGVWGGLWHLYCPRPFSEGWGYHATSADGLNFVRQPDVFIDSRLDWLGNVLAGANGLFFYGSGRTGGWAAFSSDGFAWTLLADRTGLGGDPAIVMAGENRYLAVNTGPLRPDAKPGPPVFSKKTIVKR
ncbi:MAG: hypothetical protein FJY82_02630 [Candidatus Aminicenantes bacterium]|nr:hypothetical protein [Candidatus Aminicenantes bacterium]